MPAQTGVHFGSLRGLFDRHFCSLYDAEHRQLDLLPQLADAASESQLENALHRHCSQTRLHAERLEAMASAIGMELTRCPCRAMEGLVEDGRVIAGATGCEKVRDAGLIVVAQSVEHYEISAYGCLRTFAEKLGLADLQQQLQQILDEEAAADDMLTELAEGFINTHAAREAI